MLLMPCELFHTIRIDIYSLRKATEGGQTKLIGIISKDTTSYDDIEAWIQKIRL
jgi:hypothetical protein